MQNKTILKSIEKLSNHVNQRRKIQFIFLCIYTIFAGLFEIISIASILPFVRLVTDIEYNVAKDLYFMSDFFAQKTRKETVIILGLFFSSLYLINSFVRVVLIYLQAYLSKMITGELSIKIYESVLYSSYSSFINKDSNILIASITQKVLRIGEAILAVLNIVSGIFIFICIISVLMFIDPQVMIFSMIFFSFLYLSIVRLSKKKTMEGSEIINQEQQNIVRNLKNGLGSMRDIILDNTQTFYLKVFKISTFRSQKKHAYVYFISNSPRYLIEGMGIFLFVILLIYWNETRSKDEFVLIFPTLAALAIGAQRILPIMNILYSNFITIKSSLHQIDEVGNILDIHLEFEKKKKKIINESLSFNKSIIFKNVTFSHDNKVNVLENANIEIPKGFKIGIVGRTGGGKSTFLDLLMGLLEPQKGSIYIDNSKLIPQKIHSWQSRISHVPQKIFLTDGTILENIALGKEVEKIDLERVKLATQRSQLHDFITQSNDAYDMKINERGAKLSGGQIQRIGLSRALYKNAELIIFDEATNSLDIKTEKLVMRELNNLEKGLTIITVAHRPEVLKECDLIFEIKDKKIIKLDKKIF